MSTLHKFRSPITDLGDPNELGPDEWNDKHVDRCGSAVLVAGTKAVLFAALTSPFNLDEPNTSYSISLSGNADENFYWSAKAMTGFTIHSSNGASTATVDWKVSRGA